LLLASQVGSFLPSEVAIGSRGFTYSAVMCKWRSLLVRFVAVLVLVVMSSYYGYALADGLVNHDTHDGCHVAQTAGCSNESTCAYSEAHNNRDHRGHSHSHHGHSHFGESSCFLWVCAFSGFTGLIEKNVVVTDVPMLAKVTATPIDERCSGRDVEPLLEPPRI
jgi:hypothetical protein